MNIYIVTKSWYEPYTHQDPQKYKTIEAAFTREHIAKDYIRKCKEWEVEYDYPKSDWDIEGTTLDDF